MQLSQLTEQSEEGLVLERSDRSNDPVVHNMAHDSRRVTPGTLFFAIEGLKTDGHLYLDRVVKSGAVGIVSERDPWASLGLPWIKVSRVRRAMAAFSDRFFGQPSRSLKLIGITGTNGKTTTAYVIHSILSQSGPALLMGTVANLYGGRRLGSTLTTPEAIDIQRNLADALEHGCRSGVLEVSSHGLEMDRAYQCRFPVAVFTNLSRDHLDYHHDFESYFRAKCLLFDPLYNPAIKSVVVNGDDPFGARIDAGDIATLSYGFSSSNDVYALRHETDVSGSRLELQWNGATLKLQSKLAGRHNLYNLMSAATACRALGIEDAKIQAGIEALESVPGRFERIPVEHPASLFVDYAHTPDALEKALQLCRTLTANRVISVFGCGGDRDPTKRPLMGEISTRLADFSIMTSDNPRTEDPARIVDEIRAGVPAGVTNFEAVVDRRQAVRRALEVARKGDIVILAGKGHETYQEIDGERIPFDDREAVREEVGA